MLIRIVGFIERAGDALITRDVEKGCACWARQAAVSTFLIEWSGERAVSEYFISSYGGVVVFDIVFEVACIGKQANIRISDEVLCNASVGDVVY